MTDTRDAALGLTAARYREEPIGVAIVVPLQLIMALAGAGVVSRATRHDRRLLATARTIRRDRGRQATKMQNGWPERSA